MDALDGAGDEEYPLQGFPAAPSDADLLIRYLIPMLQRYEADLLANVRVHEVNANLVRMNPWELPGT